MALLTTAFLDTRTYGFEWLRYLLDVDTLQEGVSGLGDYKVTAAAAGGMRVDIAAGTALVRGDTGTRNAMYIQVNDAAIANAVTLAASNATNPRIDQIILRVRDSSDLGDASDTPTLEVVTGTATAGATLDNRTGAAALPANAVRLADILVPAASAAVTAANVRDRRPWARGAYRSIIRNTANYTLGVQGALTLIDATNLNPRIECSGAPVRARLTGSVAHSTAGQIIGLSAFLDGVSVLGGTGHVDQTQELATAAQVLTPMFDFVPAAGSHLIGPAWSSSAATATINASATVPLQFSVEEIIRPNTDNT